MQIIYNLAFNIILYILNLFTNFIVKPCFIILWQDIYLSLRKVLDFTIYGLIIKLVEPFSEFH